MTTLLSPPGAPSSAQPRCEWADGGLAAKLTRMLKPLRGLLIVLVIAATAYLAWPAIAQTRAVPYERRVSNPEYERKSPPVFQRVPPEERQAWILLIWEDAAKVEFWIVAGAVCIWMLLPRILDRSQKV